MRERFHILVSDHLDPVGWELLQQAGDIDVSGPCANREELLAQISQADALIIRSSTRVDSALLAAAPRLKIIARAGAQLQNVDLDEATRRGIMVAHAPQANLYAVAEHTFALLLAYARQVPAGQQAMIAGEWPRHSMQGAQLHGKTLGIIGYGRLGKEVARRAAAFGMRVLAYDPFADLVQAREQQVEIANLPDLLARSGFISLHTALTPQTRRLMNAAVFKQVKPGAVLINCTHAGLVDEAALLAALKSGRLAGAALDTLEDEPPPAGHPLVGHPNVLTTPHLNQNTLESQALTSRQIVEDVLAALRGEDFRNIVNLPFSAKTPYLAVRPYIHLAEKLGKLQGQLAEGWILRVEVETVGEGVRGLVRPVAAVLLSGMLLSVDGRKANWVSAPVLANEQGITAAQVAGLMTQEEYPNVIACRVCWQGGERTVAGVLFANGEARLVQYDRFKVDAYPSGDVLVLENTDKPGVIGKIGSFLGRHGINIAQWRYGRDHAGGKAVSFINLDGRLSPGLLAELEMYPEVASARLVRL